MTYEVINWACDGSTEAVVDTRFCSIPTITFNGEPFVLSWGDLVYVIISASNIQGTSPYSDPGSGGPIMTTPDTPINFQKDIPNSDGTKITLTWEEGPEFKGSNIIDYTLHYDQGLGTGDFVVLDNAVLGTTYTLTTVTTGTAY